MYSTAGNYDRYDRFGRTIKQKWERYSGTALTYDHINYGYDYAGNRKWREDVLADDSDKSSDEYYTYDGLHRLKAFDRGYLAGDYSAISGTPDLHQGWNLNQLGNSANLPGFSTNPSAVYNSANELLLINGSTAYVGHDLAGNMTKMPLFNGGAHNLTYDPWNRLVEVRDSASNIVTLNEYDGLGQRIVHNDGTINDGKYEYYYNDKWQLLTQTRYVSAVETIDSIYHWHPTYIDALATRMRASDTHHFTFDANFNITAAVDTSTDTVVERYNYTPYGEVTFLEDDFDVASSQFSTIGNQHLYTGRERDRETGLQLNRHRYYASHLGRWLTRDPIAYLGDSTNLYEYTFSMPLIYVDPTGLRPPPSGLECYLYYSEWGNSAPADPWWMNWGAEAGDVAAIAGGAGAAIRKCVQKCAKKKLQKEIAKEAADEFFKSPMRDPRKNIPPYNNRLPRITPREPPSDYIPPHPWRKPGPPPDFSPN
jgi:RHS repeat-associated protein